MEKEVTKKAEEAEKRMMKKESGREVRVRIKEGT